MAEDYEKMSKRELHKALTDRGLIPPPYILADDEFCSTAIHKLEADDKRRIGIERTGDA